MNSISNQNVLHVPNRRFLKDLIDDYDLQNNGVKLYYVVDPFEVFSYCFPFEDLTYNNFNEYTCDVKKSQIALYFLFEELEKEPILLDEYVVELQERIAWLRLRGLRNDKIIERLLGKLIEKYKLSDIELNDSISQATKEKIVKELLINGQAETIAALQMDIWNTGATDLYSLVERLKVDQYSNQSDSNRDRKQIAQVFREAKPGSLSTTIFNHLSYPNQRAYRKSKYRQNANNRRDANAIDRLIHVNEKLRKKSKSGELDERHIFLYLSSAERTKSIFNSPSVREAQSDAFKANYSIWRTRWHLFYSSILDLGKDGLYESIKQMVDKDTQTHRDDQRFCDQCFLRDSENNVRDLPILECEVRNSCLEISKNLEGLKLLEITEKRANVISSLGLIRKVSESEQTFKSSEKSVEHLDGAWKIITSVVDKFQTDSLSQGNDVSKLQTRQIQLGDAHLQLLKKSTHGFLNIKAQEISNDYYLRKDRDSIQASSQHLPIMPLEVDSEYFNLITNITEYFTLPPLESELNHRRNLLISATQTYFQIDSEISLFEAQPDPYHEIARLYLLLAYPSVDVDEQALHNAEYAKRWKLDSSDESKSSYEKEFDYIICWAARRCKNYNTSIRIANQQTKKSPADPRFYHGKALAICAWVEDKNIKSKNNPEFTYTKAIENIKIAIDKYQSFVPATKSPNVKLCLAACYNTLIMLMIDENENRDLTEARQYMTKLKDTIAQEKWDKKYPEFYHTESLLEFEEYKVEENPLAKKQKLFHCKEVTEKYINNHDPSYLDNYGKHLQEHADLVFDTWQETYPNDNQAQ